MLCVALLGAFKISTSVVSVIPVAASIPPISTYLKVFSVKVFLFQLLLINLKDSPNDFTGYFDLFKYAYATQGIDVLMQNINTIDGIKLGEQTRSYDSYKANNLGK